MDTSVDQGEQAALSFGLAKGGRESECHVLQIREPVKEFLDFRDTDPSPRCAPRNKSLATKAVDGGTDEILREPNLSPRLQGRAHLMHSVLLPNFTVLAANGPEY